MYLPEDLPDRWDLAFSFATGGETESRPLSAQQIKVLAENLKELDAKAFVSDRTLQEDILSFPKEKPLGIILISSKKTCSHCGNGLLVCKDRPLSLAVYNDDMGSIPATQYHKYCTNRRCHLTQYHGYHTKGSAEGPGVFFDEDCHSLPYFVSSRETAFSVKAAQEI